MGDDQVCRCGHTREAHRHHHDRTYCGLCGRDLCRAYQRPPGRLLALIRRRQ